MSISVRLLESLDVPKVDAQEFGVTQAKLTRDPHRLFHLPKGQKQREGALNSLWGVR